MQVFIWRSYLGQPAWFDDVQQLFFACQDRLMQGKEHTMIEMYLSGRVQRQFGKAQDRPDDQYMAIFVRSKTQSSWGWYIPAHEAVQIFMQLVAKPWPYDQGQADLGTTQTYRDQFRPPLRLTIPGTPSTQRKARGRGAGRGRGDQDQVGRGLALDQLVQDQAFPNQQEGQQRQDAPRQDQDLGHQDGHQDRIPTPPRDGDQDQPHIQPPLQPDPKDFVVAGPRTSIDN